MSKKDYIAIARVLHALKPDLDERTPAGDYVWDAAECAGARRMLSRVGRELSVVLSADNPAFDRARFLEACETGADTESAKRARAASKAALKAQRAAVTR